MVPIPCKTCRCSHNPSSLLIFWRCFIFVPSFVKISQQVSKLLSRHYFQTEIFKGHNSLKNVGQVMVLISAHSLMMLYIWFTFVYLYKVSWKYSRRYWSYRVDTILKRKNSKVHNSVKNVDGVTVLFLCTSSDGGFYLNKVSWKYS